MKKERTIGVIVGILATVIFLVGAVPYGTELACVYVRPLDTRDGIYNGIGIPKPDFTDKFGGLSERTVIFGNLQIIPSMMNDLDILKKQTKANEAKIKSLEKQVAALTKQEEQAADPNEVAK